MELCDGSSILQLQPGFHDLRLSVPKLDECISHISKILMILKDSSYQLKLSISKHPECIQRLKSPLTKILHQIRRREDELAFTTTKKTNLQHEMDSLNSTLNKRQIQSNELFSEIDQDLRDSFPELNMRLAN